MKEQKYDKLNKKSNSNSRFARMKKFLKRILNKYVRLEKESSNSQSRPSRDFDFKYILRREKICIWLDK